MTEPTERIVLIPAPLEIEGVSRPRLVRKPSGPYLAQDGEEVTLDTYWRRKLDAGEVVPATATPSANAWPVLEAGAKAAKSAKAA